MLNRVMLMGTIGRLPEIYRTLKGRKIATISLVTSESWRDKVTGESKERVERHRLVAFDKHADLVDKRCRKGTLLLAEGRLRTRKLEDKPDAPRYVTEVVVSGPEGKLIVVNDVNSGLDAVPEEKSGDQQARLGPVSNLDAEIQF